MINTYNVIAIIIAISSLLKFKCSYTVQFGQAQERKEVKTMLMTVGESGTTTTDVPDVI